MENIVNENDYNEPIINEFIHIIEDEDITQKSIKQTKSVGERLDETISWINEFLNNTIIYFGDVYMVVNELFDPIRNCIKNIYIIKFKMP
jgi:hypothetical protein